MADIALQLPASASAADARAHPPDARTGPGGDSLCVMFLQDLREMEARLRTEKLAAMGRMSAAVAHEIRNPLAAIAQANELLAEELSSRRTSS
jgi:two-component system sensor histidine kinase PilS (NtrC family)